MRLFQAQPVYGENSSPPPPPPYSIEREATRVMPVYLSHFRDGRHRLPTPEKIAVMELSSSFERRRLGKHQQILTDISQRCREQEINDLSTKLSSKVDLKQGSKQDKEMNLYSTYLMRSRKRRNSMSNVDGSGNPNTTGAETNESSKTIYEQNYKQFPARRIMRHNTRFDFLKPHSSTPRSNNQSNAPKSSSSDTMLSLRARLAHRQQINGPIQLDHYTTPRPDLAPLVLSNERFFPPSVQTERLDRSDTYFSTSRVVLGPRGKSSLNFVHHDPTLVAEQPGHGIPKPIPMELNKFGREMSSLQLTSGHSPPPNSIQGVQVQ